MVCEKVMRLVVVIMGVVQVQVINTFQQFAVIIVIWNAFFLVVVQEAV